MFKKLLLLYIAFIPLILKAQFEPNYGIILNLNYPTIGNSIDNYVGRGLGSFGMFYERPISPYHASRFLNSFDFTLEPAITLLGFRDQMADKRYDGTYLDFTGYFDFIPDRMSNDLKIMLGARPSVMLNTNSEILEFGNYRVLSYDPVNLNYNGRFDFSGVLGISVSLGDVASVELKYAHSFTNQNTKGAFYGRPNMLEFGIRLSAIKIRDKLIANERNLIADLNKKSEGTLLIMLELPNEKLIKVLVQENKVDDAHFVRMLQTQTNKNIINQFHKYFNFCKVAFFMDSSAQRVSRGDFKGVFVDENLNPLSDVVFDSSNYMIGSFCEDVSDYTKKSDYGLYIYDHNFIQLGKPYNSNANHLSVYIGGDPLNYFRRIKTTGYFAEDFGKIIKRLSDRLTRLRIPVNQ